MIFEPALRELSTSENRLFGPTSFRDYVDRHDLDASPHTPRYISVDSVNDLSPMLRDAGVMVLRVGSAQDGTGTAFLLVKAPNGAEEFFLQDQAIFDDRPVEQLATSVDRERLLNFRLMPSLSETSLVNLALASGVLAEALELDTSGALAPPATGRSTFSFDVRPHSDLPETVAHRNGQVEIDTLFTERRDGSTTLFIIEAKTGKRASLAKHKLVYPVLAVAGSVSPDIDIVPVYMRCQQTDETIRYEVAECHLPDPRERLPGVDELGVERSRLIELDIDE